MQTKYRTGFGRAAIKASRKVGTFDIPGTQSAVQSVPYMGYVFSSDCAFQTRESGFFKAAFKKAQRFLLPFRPNALLQGSRHNLFAPGAI
jgi:hypothetical protein